jgi:hypothetical protein
MSRCHSPYEFLTDWFTACPGSKLQGGLAIIIRLEDRDFCVVPPVLQEEVERKATHSENCDCFRRDFIFRNITEISRQIGAINAAIPGTVMETAVAGRTKKSFQEIYQQRVCFLPLFGDLFFVGCDINHPVVSHMFFKQMDTAQVIRWFNGLDVRWPFYLALVGWAAVDLNQKLEAHFGRMRVGLSGPPMIALKIFPY